MIVGASIDVERYDFGGHFSRLIAQVAVGRCRFPTFRGHFAKFWWLMGANVLMPLTGLSAGEAAMGEPLAATLHATKQAGSMLGKRVFVTGCGPIGILSILSARRAGADHIVTTDLLDFTLAMAQLTGADDVVNLCSSGDGLARYSAG
jgi:L-idonate 5-dehydrogenase